MESRVQIAPFPVSSGSTQDWERWKKTLNFYFTSEKITDANQKQAKLILLGGKEIQDLYYTLPTITEYPTGMNAFSYTIECFDSKLGKVSSKWFERFQLSEIKQKSDEKFTSFVTRIRNQSQKCQFLVDYGDEAIQLQIIIGCNSPELRKELMRTKAKTKLAEFEDIARTYESVAVQSAAMTSCPKNSNSAVQIEVNKVFDKKKKDWKKKKTGSDAGKSSTNTNSESGKDTCFCCGHVGHKANDPKCPAKKAICGKCTKKGHYARVCKTPVTNTTAVKSVMISDESVFCVDCDEDDSKKNDEMVPCVIGGVAREMFVDSGSLYSITSIERWQELEKSNGFRVIKYLPKPRVNFHDGSQNVKYTVCRTALVEIACNDRKRDVEMIIVKEKFPLLLGRTDAKALGVLRVGLQACSEADEKVNAVTTRKALGKLKDFQLSIDIDPNVTPVMQHVARIPYGLRKTLEEKIQELLDMDVIEKVEGASSWISPALLAPKSNDDFRLCVDMRRANEAVICEKHPMPAIEDVEPQLKDASRFSIVDLLQAYHQIELDEKSREITTFWTHLGLFRFKRLGEGIRCAPADTKHWGGGVWWNTPSS